MKKHVTIIAIILLMISSNYLNAEKISLVYIADTHSCLSPGGPRNNELNGEVGGIARAASIIIETQMQNENTMFLHGGDFFIGDLFFNKYFGVVELKLLLELGLDAMTVGNHEFDLTPDMLTMSLAEGFSEGSFPMLSANYEDNGDESLKGLSSFIQKYTIKQYGDIKIGIFGMTTPETMLTSQPGPAVISDDIPNIAADMVTLLREKGCKIVIMLSHMGINLDTKIAVAIPGIDLILGAHDHIAMQKPLVTDASGHLTRIIHCGAFYRSMGKMNFNVDENGISSFEYELIYLDQNIPELESISEQVKQLISEIELEYGMMYSDQIAYVQSEVDELAEDMIFEGNHDTPVGNLVCDAFLNEFEDADVAVEPGGMTANPLYEGPIVGSDIYRMLSYGFNEVNTLGYRMATFDVTGEVLYQGIMFGLQDIALNDEFFIQVGGMEYEYEVEYYSSDPGSSTIKDLKIKVEEDALDAGKTYKVVANEFIVMFFQLLGYEINNVVIHDRTEFMVVMDYIVEKQTITPYKDGRIKNVKTTNVKDINKRIKKKGINLFPNPCDNFLNIQLQESMTYEIMIFDNHGEVYNEILGIRDINNARSLLLDTSCLSSGKYYILIKTKDNNYVKHFIVNK